MRHLTRVFVFLIGLVLLRGAAAQTGAVPPLDLETQKREKEAREEAILNGALAMPSEIIKGGAVLNHQMGQSGSVQILGIGESVAGYTKGAVAGAKILGSAYRDGVNGALREGAQATIDYGADSAAEFLAQQLAGRAVASGVSAVAASGGAGFALTAGSMFGTYLRNSPAVGHSLGLRGTIGDEVDNAYFAVTPDWVKEAYSGVKQVDLNDPAVWQKMEDDARRRRWQSTFDAVQQQNAEQQRQMAAYASAAAQSQAPAEPAAPEPDPSQLFLHTLINAGATAPEPKLSSSLNSVPKACKLDPKTGCHPGHDEKSHPGGCKVC